MSSRIDYFDTLRGLAILGVVAIHSSGTGLQYSDTSINFNFTVLWRNLLNFSVPIFLSISAYFLAKKRFDSPKEYLDFLKKQIPRVYIPLIFWSTFWLALAVFIHNRAAMPELFKLATFQSTGPYYFIALIIQFYILFPVFNRFANDRGLIFSILISIIMTGIIYYLRYYTDINLPLIIYAGNFVTWMMFFVLGLYAGSKKINISNKVLVISIIFFYTLSCIESYVLIAIFQRAGDAVTAVKASSFIYSFFIIIFLFNNRDLIKSELLTKIGKISFGIYLTHMFPLTVTSMLISRLFPSLQAFTYAYQFLIVSIVLLSCFMLISLSNKLLSDKQARLIGFR